MHLSLLGENRISLKARNLPPFDFGQYWTLWLGADALGRPLLVRLIQAASTTIGIALVTVLTSLVGGTLLGVIAGYFGGIIGNLIMRVSDIILGFPTLLVALFGLYLFGPSVANLIIVLAVTRMPAYIRVARAETLEVRERLFVDAARVFGGGPVWILRSIFSQCRADHADPRLGQSRHGHAVRIRSELSRPRHPAARA